MGLLDFLPGLYADPYANNPNLASGPIIDGPKSNWLIDRLMSQPGMLNNPAPAAAPSAPPAAPAASLPTAPQSVTYPSPLQAEPSAADAAAYGSMGIDPGSLPQRSPFDVPQAPLPSVATATPAPSPFDAGARAAPFGFAGAGSNIVSPSQIAAPAAVPLPAPRPAAADALAAPAPSAAPAAPAPAAAADDEEDATTPANAAPTSGVAPVAAPAPFSLAGSPGFGDRLQAAFQGSQGVHGLIPKLFNFGSGLVTGQRADMNTPAMNATAQALISKGATPAEAAAAVGNPTLMKALIDQYYGNDKFAHVEVEDQFGRKTPRLYNTKTGEWVGGPPPGAGSMVGGDQVMGPDGKLHPIPAGVDPKLYREQMTRQAADTASGKLTEAQAKASSFAARMQQAEGAMGGLQNEGLSLTGAGLSALPGGNLLQSGKYQQYQQAKSAFITAMLRQESGAAISKSEFERYDKELFPQPGDSPQVVAQKQAMRQTAMQQMQRAAGPGYQGPPALPSQQGLPSGWSVQVH